MYYILQVRAKIGVQILFRVSCYIHVQVRISSTISEFSNVGKV